MLTEEQIERYSRQLLLPGWGSRQQQKLLSSSVAISGRAEVAARYLIGAGVGTVTFLGDVTEAAMAAGALNPDVSVNIGSALETGSAFAMLFENEPFEGQAATVVVRISPASVELNGAKHTLPAACYGNTSCAEALAASLVIESLANS